MEMIYIDFSSVNSDDSDMMASKLVISRTCLEIAIAYYIRSMRGNKPTGYSIVGNVAGPQQYRW